ncbi:hypothetical protein BSKO_13145 [Bryopsis sp. KO-2023]|nr:hypothetical protein BSKO_13145 [Bryopsis sp. KO-2023]
MTGRHGCLLVEHHQCSTRLAFRHPRQRSPQSVRLSPFSKFLKFRARASTTMSAIPFYSIVPMGVMADSYKATHFAQYPPASKLVAYGEFRCGYNKDTEDTRLVWHGLRYILETFVQRQWTLDDLEKASKFYSTHMLPFSTEFPFPKELFRRFITENDGYFPVKIEALPEGTCVHAHVPVYQLTAEGDYAHLCTFLETVMTMVWYPSTVATLSRRARDVIERAFEKSSNAGKNCPTVTGRLHDFGFRGCTCPEQSIIGGTAHLLNFTGSDTMSAAFYAQFHLNDGKPVAMSVPATEHSVMTSWQTELDAMKNMVENFGDGVYSIVMDSYNYERALFKVMPIAKESISAKQGSIVIRPDSGDPVEAVCLGLKACDEAFGADKNAKGYRVLRKSKVLQGDGIDVVVLEKILDAVLEAGYSAENCVFGMGGGLLQKLNRDTMSFATKLSHITHQDGASNDIMKTPKGASSKTSLPGVLAVKRVDGVPTVFPAEDGWVNPEENMLKVVYDKGPVEDCILLRDDFDTLRARVAKEWSELPKTADVISAPLKEKMERVQKEQEARYNQSLEEH